MSDDFEQQEWVRLGVAANMSRQYSSDQREFLERLATTLISLFPGEVEIARSGGFFSKKKPVQKIRLNLGEWQYILEDPGRGNLIAARTRVVRGIALKTETITVPELIEEMGEFLELRAHNSQAIRDALGRLVN